MLDAKLKENEWQQFFNANPFVLTETLPLKFDAIFSQVPLLAGTPDYLFHRKAPNSVTGDFGVIELKRPDQSIVGTYSSKIITPSRHVRAAQQQTTQYLESVKAGNFINTEDFFAAGNRHYAFIIIGSSAEVTRKCHDDILRAQFKNLMPAGFHLYTYDEVYDLFRDSAPPIIQVLFASPYSTNIVKVSGEFEIKWKGGLHARPAAKVVHIAGRFNSRIEMFASDEPGERVDAKSILGLLLLGLAAGKKVGIEAEGHDSVAALGAIAELIARDFDSPSVSY